MTTTMPEPPPGDAAPSYIVIGTSLGGFVALSAIFSELPADLPAAILVVMHVQDRGSMTFLRDQLARLTRLPIKIAEDEEVIRQGVAYIAPSSTHLLVDEGRVKLGTGPMECHVRPAVDALFRTAADMFGPKVIGVVLTGMLQDGTLGLRAIRDAGGITIVQNPETSEAGDMPRNAMQGLGVDFCLELSEIGPLLDLLVRRIGLDKQGILESGLASAVRLMHDRARLLVKLHGQSAGNPKTAAFLSAEIAALDHAILDVKQLIALKPD